MAPVDQSILVPSQPTPKLLTLRLLSRLRLCAGRFLPPKHRGRQEGTLGLLSCSVCYKSTIEVPLGEEGFREIAITLIIKVPISRFGLFGQPPG